MCMVTLLNIYSSLTSLISIVRFIVLTSLSSQGPVKKVTSECREVAMIGKDELRYV